MIPTLEQWHNHPSFRKELQELLDHPTFVTAMEMVKERGNQPANLLAIPAGATLTEWYAAQGAKREGYFEALINLRSLAQVSQPRQQGPKPWENVEQPKNNPDAPTS